MFVSIRNEMQRKLNVDILASFRNALYCWVYFLAFFGLVCDRREIYGRVLEIDTAANTEYRTRGLLSLRLSLPQPLRFREFLLRGVGLWKRFMN